MVIFGFFGLVLVGFLGGFGLKVKKEENDQFSYRFFIQDMKNLDIVQNVCKEIKIVLYYCGIVLFFLKERQMGKIILFVDDEVEIIDIY